MYLVFCWQYGLYSAFMGGFIYCFFGTSKDITLGPTAIMSLLVAEFASERSPIHGDATYAILLTLISGLITLAMGLLNLGQFYTTIRSYVCLSMGAIYCMVVIAVVGFIVQFISYPVISGFTSAAAIVIAMSQVKVGLSINTIAFHLIEGTGVICITCTPIHVCPGSFTEKIFSSNLSTTQFGYHSYHDHICDLTISCSAELFMSRQLIIRCCRNGLVSLVSLEILYLNSSWHLRKFLRLSEFQLKLLTISYVSVIIWLTIITFGLSLLQSLGFLHGPHCHGNSHGYEKTQGICRP